MTIGDDWTDTGISGKALPTGVYAVMISGAYNGSSSWQASETWAGILGWYDDETNSGDGDEVVLHASGHAKNGCYLKMRTLSHGRGGVDNSIQLKYSYGTPNIPITIKFKKLI